MGIFNILKASMNKVSFLLLLALALPSLYEAALPTLYEYYTSDGISSGISIDKPYFTLNGKNITIHSGAIHYFRVPHQHWRDRLRKLRASGCNAVETYAPWNLHEPESGVFDFGDLVDSRYNNLNVTDFFRIAQEEDLFVLFRPGPYICAEWEYGGFPSWLLRNKETIVRTSEKTYVEHVTNYYNRLLPLIKNYQFTNGGPIIALQVENEYGHVWTENFEPDLDYMHILVDLFRNNGINELLYTSDNAWMGTQGALPGELLQTINFADDAQNEFDTLLSFQPGKPVMAMEFWTGWFDTWGQSHYSRDNDEFRYVYEQILKYPASVNLYMFIGGTNFGFMNGANVDTVNIPLTTSYDYDSVLAENGDYTEKYEIVSELLQQYKQIDLLTPDRPALVPRVAYPEVRVTQQIFLKEIYDSHTNKIYSENPIPMELLPVNNDNGQSYGYTVYQAFVDLPANSTLTISGYVSDSVMVLVNGRLSSKPLETAADLDGFGYWRLKDSTVFLTDTDLKDASLDIIVENLGRVNSGPISYFQAAYKGLNQDVLLNGQVLTDWYIVPLDFKQDFNEELSGWESWHDLDLNEVKPAVYKAGFEIYEDPVDTYIDMSDWTKGIVILNGFVLGRHFKVGPTQALYVPGPYLNKGWNEIIVFEQFKPSDTIKFSTDMIYYTN